MEIMKSSKNRPLPKLFVWMISLVVLVVAFL